MFYTKLFHLPWPVLILAVVSGLLFFTSIARFPFFNKGEPREALVVQDIVNHGNWLFPLRKGSEVPSKPPLFHWLGAAVSMVRGQVSEATVRFPSAFFAMVGVYLVYLFGLRIFDPSTALMAGLILATSADYQRLATVARVDMTLTFCVTLSLVLFYFLYEGRLRKEGWYDLFYFLLGLGALAKGPVSLILVGLVIMGFLAWERRWDFLGRLALRRGVLLTIIVVSSWYGLAWYRGGEEFFQRQVIHENLARFFNYGQEATGHEKPFYYYVPYLLGGALPWSLFLPVWALSFRQEWKSWSPGTRFLTVWVIVIFFFFSFSAGKRPPYILPLYPALSLLLAAWLTKRVRFGKRERIGLRLLGAVSGALGGLFTLWIVGLLWYDEPGWVLDWLIPLLKPRDQSNLLMVKGELGQGAGFFTLFLCVSAALWFSAAKRLRALDLRAVPSRFIALALLSGFLVQNLFIPPLAKSKSYRPFMQQVDRAVGSEPVYLYAEGIDPRPLLFYRPGPTMELHGTRQELAGRLQRSGDYFIMSARVWREVGTNRNLLQPLLRSHEEGSDEKSILVLVRGRAMGIDS